MPVTSTVKHVIKRDGSVVPFDLDKIAHAVSRAGHETGQFDADEAVNIAHAVLARLEEEVTDEERALDAYGIERIQDAVEKTIASIPAYWETARAYIEFRDKRAVARSVKQAQVDAVGTVSEYLSRADWRVNANANQGYSVGGLILNAAGKIIANYWLDEVYPSSVGLAHREGRFHIHDLDMLGGYCAGWSLRTLLNEGFNGVPAKVESAPPKHLDVAMGQMVNFLGTLQNEWAGAQAFSSTDTYLAPFVRVDHLSYEEVKQCMQTFVFSMNVPSRWGTQTPFSNLTFDWVCPDDVRDDVPLVGGEPVDFTYGDLQPEMDMINRAFMEVMTEGDAKGRVFTFPIPTYNITPDFPWESENANLLFDMTAKYGLPYFQNFVNSELEPHMVRSMCPLRGDQRVLVRDDFTKEWHVSTISNLYNGNKAEKVYDVFYAGEAHKARINRFDGLSFSEVTTVNGHSVVLSDNHTNRIQRVLEDGSRAVMDVPTSDLRPGDYLPFNNSFNGGDDRFDFGVGYLLGAYMGDGSMRNDGCVTYSVNGTTKSVLRQRIHDICELTYGARVTENVMKGGSCIQVHVTSKSFAALVCDIVTGTALDKAIDPKVFGMSLEFRLGMVTGLMDSDGTRSKSRVYTASKAGLESICLLMASVGLPTRVSVDDRAKGDGKLSDNPVWCVRYFDPRSGQRSYGDLWYKEEDAMWFKVTSVEPASGDFHVGYCFEVVDGTEPMFMLPNGMLTHNCRLQLDLRELLKRGNGLFGSAEQTGSVGVVTINMARLGYKHRDASWTTDGSDWSSFSDEELVAHMGEMLDRQGLVAELDELLTLARISLELKRKTVQHLMDTGLYPYTRRYLGTLRNHFSTIGVNGINEMIRNLTCDAHDITSRVGHAMALAVLDHIRAKMVEFQEETGHLYNLEATPAEGTTYRFAREDIKRYPDIIHAGTDAEPYYTNSSQLPVSYTTDPFQALAEQEDLQKKYTGGTVLHLYLGERVSDGEACKQLVKRSLESFRLPYITVTPTFSICPKHGYIAGEHQYCPICDEEIVQRKKIRMRRAQEAGATVERA